MSNDIPDRKIRWGEILVFYAIAVLVSAPFRLGLIKPEAMLPLPQGLSIFYHVLRGIGPAVGFAVMYYLVKSRATLGLSFFGLKRAYSLLAAAVIPLGLVIAGVKSSSGFNAHYAGLLTGLMLVLYSLGEEYGWRGYLQQALEPLKPLYRVLLIAVMWYLWHLNFLLPGNSIRLHVIHFVSLVLGSWGLLKVSQSTYSILFASAVHLSFNIVSDVDADLKSKLIILGIAVVVWIVLIRSLGRSENDKASRALP